MTDTLSTMERDQGLERQLAEARHRQRNSEALLAAARSIPMAETFTESARAIFDACKAVTGATAGYVALLSATGEENEVLFLDAGGLPCSVDPSLPMPIRGLRGVSYETNRAVYDNAFGSSQWMRFMPAGHVDLRNVMFSPLVVGDKTVGLIGLANKDGDFTDEDAEAATRFGELAAVALRYARYQDELRRWSRVFQHAEWGVAVVDPENLSLNMINPAFAAMHGYRVDELASKALAGVWASAAQEERWKQLAMLEQQDHYGFETQHRRKDGSVFPVFVDATVVRESESDTTGGHEAMEAEENRYWVFNVQDITERKAAEDALRRSNLELREYAGVAAHELQEPLRLIASYTQLLARRYHGRLDEEADEFIGYATGAADRLQRLLQGLLVYSQVGSDDSHAELVDCGTLLDETLCELQETIQARHARVTHDALPVVRAHRRELALVFHHLIGNALDNGGDRPPEVHVSAETQQDGSWRFSVRDQGVGIAPRHQEGIFRLFGRLQGPTEGDGVGIGLALCKKIVQRHGGRIWVESEPAQGAGFHFTLGT